MKVYELADGEAGVLRKLAPGVFDDPLDERRTAEFLADARHHLVVAVDDGAVIGMISAVHYVHPDKPRPEMWINEVAVGDAHQGRGVGRAMMREVLDVARALDCAEAWVLTDRGNARAMRLYAGSGGAEHDPDSVMFEFMLDEPASS